MDWNTFLYGKGVLPCLLLAYPPRPPTYLRKKENKGGRGFLFPARPYPNPAGHF